MPADAPRVSNLLADHPFLIEFKYTPSPVTWAGVFRYQRALADWALVLNVLLHGGARMIGRRTRQQWTLVPRGTEGELRSEYLQEGYSVPGLSDSLKGFSSAGSVPAMAVVPNESYYDRVGISDQALDVPECLPSCVIGFSKLESQIRDKFLRCAYWFYQSSAAWTNSVSVSFVCLVSAIEALLPPVPSGVPCRSCGKGTNPGPTKRLADFLDSMVPSLATNFPDARKKLYSVRSKLSHGETLLRIDDVRNDFNPSSVEERQLVRQAHTIVRMAARKWLLKTIAA